MVDWIFGFFIGGMFGFFICAIISVGNDNRKH